MPHPPGTPPSSSANTKCESHMGANRPPGTNRQTEGSSSPVHEEFDSGDTPTNMFVDVSDEMFIGRQAELAELDRHLRQKK